MTPSPKKHLRDSNIFDFTSDQKLLESIIGIEDISKADYLEFASDRAIIIDMVAFAEETQNTDLLASLKKEFAKELASLFNE